MIGRTLFIYFLRRYLVMTFQFLIGVMVIAYLADFTEFARRASSLEGYTATLGLYASLLKMPILLQMAIPFTILFAGMATLMTLNRRYELVVTRAAGVSAWQFLAPMCAASLCIGILVVVIVNPISARTLGAVQEIEASLFGGSAGRSGSGRPPWLRQHTDEGATVIGAASTARRGMLLSEATFLRMSKDEKIVERIDARQAVLLEGAWDISDAIVYRHGVAPRRVESMRIKSDLQPEFIEEQFAAPEAIPFFELPEKIAAARSFGRSGDAFATQFHSLVALPMLLVTMTLIAATVSMRFTRMGQSEMIILGGVVAGFLLYVGSVLVKAFGSAGIVPPIVAAWFPVVVAGLFGVTYLLNKEDG